MRCTNPRDVGFKSDGKTICWSPRQRSKEFATFQLPCGKCIECRLEYARQWAVRCVHESKMYENNSFITLTYSDENLKSPKLQYRDFQLFMKRLRKTSNEPIGVFVTGEYGEKNKRPHWHAIIFNWRPKDLEFKYKTERGDTAYDSKTLEKLWGLGSIECGSVTFESAGYCARYAAKKLVHGHDGNHDFEPLSRKSNKHAIGKKYLEKYYKEIFDNGEIRLSDGTATTIPRYYEKWLKQHQPESWERYVTQTKQNKITKASIRESRLDESVRAQNEIRRVKDGFRYSPQTTKIQARIKIVTERFKNLQKHLKL